MKLLFTILLILLTAASWQTEAQTSGSRPYFKRIGLQEGMPDNSVNVIAQDAKGFLWGGTWQGLVRYDGIQTRVFRHEPGNPHSLCNGMIRDLAVRPDGLWIATDSGLDFYDYADGTFHHSRLREEKGKEPLRIQQRVSHLLQTPSGMLALLGDGRIAELEDEGGGHHGYIFRPVKQPPVGHIADFTLWRNGEILTISDRGVTLLDRTATKALSHIDSPSNFDTYTNIYCDTTANKIFAGYGIGHESRAFRIDPRSRALTRDSDLRVPPNLMSVTAHHGSYFFATDGDGLIEESGDGKQTQYTLTNSTLSSDALYTVYSDRNDNLWIGTYRHGIALFSPTLNYFRYATTDNGAISYSIVTAILPMGGNVMLGLDGGGIDICSRDFTERRNLNAANSGLPGDNVISFAADGQRVWCAVYTKGLVCLNPADGSAVTYTIPEEMEHDNKLWTIADDGKGNIWIGGTNLTVFRKATGIFQPVEGAAGASVTSMARQGGYMWVATKHNGLLKYDTSTMKAVQRSHTASGAPDDIRLPSKSAEYIYLDSKGTLWVNLHNDGLYAFNTHSPSRMARYGMVEGLVNTHVTSMTEDSNGFLWAGTENGLYRFNPETMTFLRIRDPRIPTTYTMSAAASQGGMIYFGSIDGVVYFQSPPAGGRQGPYPEPSFTELAVMGANGEQISLYSGTTENVTLSHDQNFFSIYYALPDLVYPGLVQYSHRLAGFDETWSEPSPETRADFTNVPPGKYTFELRHTLPDGSWSDPISMGIRVRPPWQASWWALTLWWLTGGTLCALAVWLWHDRMISQQRARIATIEKEASEKLNEEKLDFYTRITHELRAPAFLIGAQMEELLEQPTETIAARRSFLEGIYRQTRRLYQLIDHLIDTRKMELGHLQTIRRDIDLTQLLETLSKDAETLCRQKDVDFSYIHETLHVRICSDSEKIEVIVTNLLTNAFKYTRPGGHITLILTQTPDSAAIVVKDTGIGITEPMREEIFKPYFRTESGRREGGGDGIGLSFVKELVEHLKGSITLQTEEGKGSEFTVTLPKKCGERELPAFAGTREEKEPAPIAPNPASGRYILLAGNDAETLGVLSASLTGDYRVACATSAEEALRQARQEKPDIILTDIILDGSDGHRLIRDIRSDRELAGVKVAVFTSLNSDSDKLAALDEGADIYLTKPLSMKLLKRQLEQLSAHSERDNDSRLNPQEQKLLSRCREIIEENMRSPDFSIETLVKGMAMSHSALYKKVKALTGYSLVDFINSYKVSKAVEMFRAGDANVQTVAEKCGFRDVKTFRDAFKKRMQCSPKQYVKKI